MEVSVRPQNIIMTSFLSLSFEITTFCRNDIGYQPSKFQCSRMSGSNFMEGDGEKPPQCLKEIKSPVLIGLKEKYSHATSARSGKLSEQTTACFQVSGPFVHRLYVCNNIKLCLMSLLLTWHGLSRLDQFLTFENSIR